jgi:hypothetical protein
MVAMAGVAQAQPVSAADSLALSITVYNAAFRNGVETAYRAPLVCVRGLRPPPDPGDGPRESFQKRQVATADPPLAVLAALQKDRAMIVRPMSACRTEPLGEFNRSISTSLVVDTLTGERGISISASMPVFAKDGTFSFVTEYYQHGLSGGGWRCEGRRERDAWIIVKCTELWIS